MPCQTKLRSATMHRSETHTPGHIPILSPLHPQPMRTGLPMLFAVVVGVAATVFASHVGRCSSTPVICEDDATKSLSAHRAEPCPSGSKPIRMAGANIYDALWDAWVAPLSFLFCELPSAPFQMLCCQIVSPCIIAHCDAAPLRSQCCVFSVVCL